MLNEVVDEALNVLKVNSAEHLLVREPLVLVRYTCSVTKRDAQASFVTPEAPVHVLGRVKNSLVEQADPLERRSRHEPAGG